MANKKEKEFEENLDDNCECNCNLNENEEICDCDCEHSCDCDCENNEENCSCNYEEGCSCLDNEQNECREEEFKDILQRLQAEFDNYRKRTESSFEKVKEDGIIHSINKLLPVLDSFKSAKTLVKDEEFLNSLNLIEKQFIDGLNALNITKIDAENEKFNPNLHNAVLTGCDENKPDDTILEVFQDGYKLGDRVIRYSVVKINKI